MSDLVKRLRGNNGCTNIDQIWALCDEAADELDRLETKCDTQKEVIAEFRKLCDKHIAEINRLKLGRCPGCGGETEHDREYPPNMYLCVKCEEEEESRIDNGQFGVGA